ncbi:MAG: protein kinase [Planctomycetota bacterium]
MPVTCHRCGADVPDEARFCQSCGAVMGDGDGDLVGKVVARKYRVLDGIGEGSMGRIYLAEHLGLEKRVALKVLHREVVLGQEGLQRFRREGVAAGKLSHPNAIEVFDFDVTEGGDAFLAMEYVEGRDLRKALDEDGPMDMDRARGIVLQALDALDNAHGQGIVHRDLKPENIMVVEGPAGPRVKVLDFGLSKLIDTRVEASLATVPGRIIGTPFYMAPEQSSGEEADTRTDLYAMGVIFYELIAGERPFTGRNLTELLYAQATQEVPSIRALADTRGLPEWVDVFITKAMERDREDRYQSAREMAQDLMAGEVASPSEPRRAASLVSGRDAGASRSGSSGRPRWLVPVVVAAAVGTLLFVFTGSGGGKDREDPSSAASGPSRASDVGAARVRMRPATSLTSAEVTYLSLLDSARGQVDGGNPDGAVGTIDALMRTPEVDAEAYLVRGSLYQATGDLDAAAADLRKACDMDPGYTEAVALLGWIEFERDRLDEALERFDAALGQDGEHADALAGRATVLLARGLGGEADGDARGLLDRAIASDAGSWRAQLGRARLALEDGDLQDAIDGFVETKRVRPRSRDAAIGLARAYLASERAEDAITQYRAALDVDGADGVALRGLAAVYLDLERFADAQDLLEPVVERGGADPRERALLGLARYGLEDAEGARRALTSAVEGGLVDARPKALLASLLLEAGEPLLALQAAEAAVDDDFDFADGHLYCGLALFRLERYEEAAAVLRRAVELDEGCTAAWFLLGVLGLDYLEDGSRAAEDLRAYLDAGGDDPRAEAWLAEIDGR